VSDIVGREAELHRASRVLSSSASGKITRAIRIAGPSGFGKTTLAQAIGDAARIDGWLVVPTPSFRIHATLPLFAARRAVQMLVDQLGGAAERYLSGLILDRERPEDFEEAFLRVIEGITLDHRLLLMLDDAQWTDAESRALITRTMATLADRSIVLLTTERSDEIDAPAFELRDQAIALGELSAAASEKIVRSIYPGASDEVVASIVAATRGRAIDIVSVATAAQESGARNAGDVGASTRRVVARDLVLLDARVRTFLQSCALIEEPIAIALLQQLWQQDELVDLVTQTSGRYLVEEPSGLRFVHAHVMESVLETIPIDIPLRYRIIDALKRLPSPRHEDLERLVSQARACGDRGLERDALLRLAAAAAATSLHVLAADATERALQLAPPAAAEIVPIYSQLSQLYNSAGRESDTIRVCRKAVSAAAQAGVNEGLGAIVASLILALWHSGRTEDARGEFERYEREVSSDADRAHLFTLGEYMAISRCDIEGARRFGERFDALSTAPHPFLSIRHHVSKSFLAMRLGQEPEIIDELHVVRQLADQIPPASVMLRAASLLYQFRYRGVEAVSEGQSDQYLKTKEPITLVLRGNAMIARAELPDAQEFAAEELPAARDALLRRSLLSVWTTAAALRGLDANDPAWQPAMQELAAFEAGESIPARRPIVAAAIIPLIARSPSRARNVLTNLLEVEREPMDLMIFSYPLLLAIAGRELDDRVALSKIASGRALWADRQPWNEAHVALARGVAAAALNEPDQSELLKSARERFERLGATYFSRLAEEALGKARKTKRPERQFSGTTRREREIAGLVSEGLTNRQIAERLVLSERTIEGHIANLFAKVNVNSRTQLATWFIRSVTPVA
jgi:DNA-binding NarL/FixJ family response regulator